MCWLEKFQKSPKPMSYYEQLLLQNCTFIKMSKINTKSGIWTSLTFSLCYGLHRKLECPKNEEKWNSLWQNGAACRVYITILFPNVIGM
jgi:hypothetical protein